MSRYIVERNISSGVDNIFAAGKISCNNPVCDVLNLDIETDEISEFDITVRDVSGRTVETEKALNGALSIDMSSFGKGLYLVEIKSSNNSSSGTIKIIKQ